MATPCSRPELGYWVGRGDKARDAINTFRGMQTRLNVCIEMALIAQSQSLVLDKGGAKSQGCN